MSAGPDSQRLLNRADNVDHPSYDTVARPSSNAAPCGNARWAITCLLALSLLIFFVTSLLEVPQIRLMERAVCKSYYELTSDDMIWPHDVDEALCKVTPIQSELALLTGWKLSFDSFPGMSCLKH